MAMFPLMWGAYPHMSGSGQSSGHSGVASTTNSSGDFISQTEEMALTALRGPSSSCDVRVHFLAYVSFAHGLIS